MTSDDIAGAIKLISEERGTKVKTDLLSEFIADPLMERVLVAAYDPMISYYHKRVEQPFVNGSGVFDSVTWGLLESLSKRLLSGNSAKDAINAECERLTAESASLFIKILKKDLRMGLAEKSINEASKMGIGYSVIKIMPYMRCKLLRDVTITKSEWEEGLLLQLKEDGMFSNNRVAEDTSCFTRNGFAMDSSKIRGYKESLKLLEKGYVYHGELVGYRNDVLLHRKISNGLLNGISRGTLAPENVIFKLVLWDAIKVKNFDNAISEITPYEERIKRIPPELLVETNIVHSLEEAMEVTDKYMNVDMLEGSVLKRKKGTWQPYADSPDQIKIKAEKECDMRIVGFKKGTGKNSQRYGSVLALSGDDKVRCSVGGFTDAELEDIYAKPEEWLNQTINVNFNSLIQDKFGEYSLYLVNFKEPRFDKLSADILEDIQKK